MFYIVDVTTGEILRGPLFPRRVEFVLRDLKGTGHMLGNLFVQADCESGYGLMAVDWLGIV